MTDSEYADDSMKMIVMIRLLEARMKALDQNADLNEEEWLQSLENINFGREILDRGFLRMFFGGGPKGINGRIRKALIELMLKIDNEYPSLRGENFDSSLKELLRKSAS